MAKSENRGKKCFKHRYDTVCKTLVAKKVAKRQKKLSEQNDNDNHTYTYTYKYDF